MKEILKSVIQKVHRECNRKGNKKKFMSMVAMLCVFSIVTSSVVQSSVIPTVANVRTASNAELATPSDADSATPSNATYAGFLVCGIEDEEHVHEQSCYCEDEAVADVIWMIHDLPTADEVDATLMAFEDAEDWDGYEEYFVYIGNKGRRAYEAYEVLTDEQKELVFNIDKLMEWSYLWSAAPLIDEIVSEVPTAVTKNVASTSDFITLNLYDYGSNINNKWSNSEKVLPGFQWNGGAYMTASSFSRTRVDNIDFGNSKITDYDYIGTTTGITNGQSSNRKNVINQGGAINKGIGYTNEPIGLSKDGYNAMSSKLSSSGYPVLATGDILDWLFKSGTYANKQNTANIDGLFQYDVTTGEYYYDSRDNHAQYENNRFTLYNQIITPNFIIYPFGNFLPLNKINNKSTATQVNKITSIGTYVQSVINDLVYDSENKNDSSTNQLIDMLARYRTNLKNESVTGGNAWDKWNARTIINEYLTTQGYSGTLTDNLYNKLYNLDWDVDTNFFFGMEMRMNFMQPKNGMTGTNDAYPMKFYFAGDDDVWVYVDNTLFLDLSGIHRHVGGDIDFKNGEVNYYSFKTYVDGEISSTPYLTLSFADILTTYGGIAEADLGKYLKVENGKYTTFLDYSSHKFDFFYMERGSGSSVCRINFNFPLLRQNSISVMKELTVDENSTSDVLGDVENTEFKFQVLKATSAGNKTNNLFIGAGAAYNLYDKDGELISSGLKTDANGVFSLKPNQRAEFNGIKENAGKYYVRELIEDNAIAQYGTITVSGESTTTSNSVTVGSDTFTGVNSPVKDASSGTTVFTFNNQIDFDKLGSLELSKELEKYTESTTSENKEFTFDVKLNDNEIPKGTKYTVDGEAKTVSTAGKIVVPAGSTVKIPSILAGTPFEIVESATSAANHTVKYYLDGNETTAPIKGTIVANTTSKIKVTNIENGAQIVIPFAKTLINNDGKSHDYTICLEQVADANGTAMDGKDLSSTVTVNGNSSTSGSFTINYLSSAFNNTTKLYYKITETAGAEYVAYDDSSYVVEVTVTKNSDTISAAITKWWKDGEEVTSDKAVFKNALLTNLDITKEIKGNMANLEDDFNFTISVMSDGEEYTDYTLTLVDENGTETTISEKGSFTLSNNQRVVVGRVPLGAKVTVKEESEGYVPNIVVSGNGNTITIDKENTPGKVIVENLVTGTVIKYTNTRDIIIDTGISMDSIPYVVMLVLVVAGIAFYVIRKRKENDLD